MHKRQKTLPDGADEVASTSGHIFLSDVYNMYVTSSIQKTPSIYIAPSSWFSSHIDSTKLPAMRKRCDDGEAQLSAVQKRACRNLEMRRSGHFKDPRTITYGIHHYFHGSGTPGATPGPPVDIMKIMPELSIE